MSAKRGRYYSKKAVFLSVIEGKDFIKVVYLKDYGRKDRITF